MFCRPSSACSMLTARISGLSLCAVAGRTRHLPHVPLVLLPGELGVRLGCAPLQVRNDAFEFRVVGPLPVVAVAVGDVDLLLDAVQHGLADVRGQPIPGGVHGEAHDLGQPLQQAGEVFTGRSGRPGVNRTAAERSRSVRDDKFRIDLFAGAEPGAFRAGTERRVERERPRFQFVEGQRVVVGAGQPLRIAPLAKRVVLVQVDEFQDDHAVGQAKSGLDGIGDPLFGGGSIDQPVDDHLDGVLLLLLELRRFGQRIDDAVDTRAGNTPWTAARRTGRRTRPCAPGSPAPEPGTGCLRPFPGRGRRSAAASAWKSVRRRSGNAGARFGRRANAGSRRSR